MSRLAKAILVSVASCLAACGEFIVDDKDFSDNRRNFDLTNDNAEAALWSAYQSTFAAIYPLDLKEVLDADAFGQNSGEVNCASGGTKTLTYPRALGERYEEGDRFTLEYTDCVTAQGLTLNGVIRGHYTELDGYNTEFLDSVDITQCVARVDEDESLASPLELTHSTDQVFFDKQGDALIVRYVDLNDGDGGSTKTTQFEYELALGQDAIVVNTSQTAPTSSLASDGAQIYLVQEGEYEEVDCDHYQRVVELTFENVVVENSEVVHRISGDVDLTDTFMLPTQRRNEIEGDLRVEVEQALYSEVHSVNELEWLFDYDPVSTGSYSVLMNVELVNQATGSITEAQSSTSSPLRGVLGEALPNDGIFKVLGISDENGSFNIENTTSITFAIDALGDRDGNGASDRSAELFSVQWTDFLDRSFVQPPLSDL